MDRIKIVTGIIEERDGRIWLGYKRKHNDWTGPGGKVEESDIYLTFADNHIVTTFRDTGKTINLVARIEETNEQLHIDKVRELTSARHESKIPNIIFTLKYTDSRFDLHDVINKEKYEDYCFSRKDHELTTLFDLEDKVYRTTLFRETKEEIRGIDVEVTRFIGTYQFESKDKLWERYVYQMKRLKGIPNITNSDTFVGFMYSEPIQAIAAHKQKIHKLAPGMYCALQDYVKLGRQQ